MASILLVDDDAEVRATIQGMLEAAGHSVRAVADGSYAIHSFEQHRPDLVITDIIMPQREGIETIRAMRAIDAAVPIIAISGGGGIAHDLDYLKLARQLGAAGSLAKPFSGAALRSLVAELLTGNAASSERAAEAPATGVRRGDRNA
ncbi:MAG: response regulator [Proteobacteria bacterium]|nr:response regulator [Pseudomonadota bacterium]